MITDDQAIKILERLLDKSRANQVNWRLNHDPAMTHLEEATDFTVTLPESSIQIAFHQPEVEPDCFLVFFKNKAGVTVKSLVIGEDQASWKLAQSLFDEAGRVTVGWDRVFDDLENAVAGQETIGIPSEIGKDSDRGRIGPAPTRRPGSR